MIWTGSGRLIGHVDAFEALVEHRYGVKLEDDFTLFNRIAEENLTAKLIEDEQARREAREAVIDGYLEDRASKIELGEELLQHLFEQHGRCAEAVKIAVVQVPRFKILRELVAAHRKYWQEEKRAQEKKEADRAEKRRAKELKRLKAEMRRKGLDDGDNDDGDNDDDDDARARQAALREEEERREREMQREEEERRARERERAARGSDDGSDEGRKSAEGSGGSRDGGSDDDYDDGGDDSDGNDGKDDGGDDGDSGSDSGSDDGGAKSQSEDDDEDSDEPVGRSRRRKANVKVKVAKAKGKGKRKADEDEEEKQRKEAERRRKRRRKRRKEKKEKMEAERVASRSSHHSGEAGGDALGEEGGEPKKRERRTHERRRFRLQYQKVFATVDLSRVAEVATLFGDEFVESLVKRTFAESWIGLVNFSGKQSRCPAPLLAAAKAASRAFEIASKSLKRLAHAQRDAANLALLLVNPEWDEAVVIPAGERLDSEISDTCARLKDAVADLARQRTALDAEIKVLYDFKEQGVDLAILEEAKL